MIFFDDLIDEIRDNQDKVECDVLHDLGEKTKWDDGKAIKIAVLQDGVIHKSFLEGIVEKTSSQYENYWKKLIFTGKAVAPKSFDTTSKALEFVAGQEGAIGYISAGEAGGSVKTITIK